MANRYLLAAVGRLMSELRLGRALQSPPLWRLNVGRDGLRAEKQGYLDVFVAVVAFAPGRIVSHARSVDG